MKELLTVKRIGLGLIFAGVVLAAASSGIFGIMSVMISLGGYYIFVHELAIIAAGRPKP